MQDSVPVLIIAAPVLVIASALFLRAFAKRWPGKDAVDGRDAS